MKIRNKAVVYMLAALCMAGVLTSCGQKDTAKKSKENKKTVEMSNEAEDVALEAEELTSNELSEIEENLNTNEYNGFVVAPFADTSKIDWSEVIYNGAGINKNKVSEKERNEYLKLSNLTEIDTDFVAIDKSDLADFMEKHAGVNIDDVDEDSIGWVYSDKYQCYYAQRGDTNFNSCTCVDGTKQGDIYTVHYEIPNGYEESVYGLTPYKTITFQKTDDGYLFESNIVDWEVGNNPEQTFDVELPQFDGASKFITWDGDSSNDAFILVTVDGLRKQFIDLGTNDSYGSGIRIHISKVTAIGVFDFNADGLKDIAVVGTDINDDEQLMLYKCEKDYSEDYRFYLDENASEGVQNAIKGELNIPTVKVTLLGESKAETFSTWQEAFATTIKYANYSSSDYRYSLVYIDEDDIPELVVDQPGYNVTAYKFMNGISCPVMDGWGYGAMGNAGYEYSPKNNCLRNYNADYAGAIMYTSYMSIHDDEVDLDYYVTDYNFDDVDGDGVPSNDELDDAFELGSGSCEYSDKTGELSASEVETKVNLIESSYEFEVLSGEYEYSEFVSQLK